MRPDMSIRYADARRAIAEHLAHTVVSRLAMRFAYSADLPDAPPGMTPVMNNDDLRNYETELTAIAVQDLKLLGEVFGDVFLQYNGIEPTDSNLAQFNVFMEAMSLYDERNKRYKDQWKESGWMGALYDIRKKAARLFRQFFGEEPTEGASEDDAWDLINFGGFFIRGRREQNKWGNWL